METLSFKKILVHGEHKAAIQAMLDYDYALGKPAPSIQAIIGVQNKIQVYKWGGKTIIVPTISKLSQYKDVQSIWGVVVMTSSRNVLKVTTDIINQSVKNIFILAENVPERDARILRVLAKKNSINIIGPASVGVLYAGDIKVSHAGGLIDNIIREKLFVKGTVGIVSKSGGMLNELMSIVTHTCARVHTAIAVGGDRFPITRIAEAVSLLSLDKAITTILVLGETGGTQENELAELLQTKKITQKVIIHILGAGSKNFDTTIQFGHAGAMAGSEEEKPDYKIKVLRESGAIVVEDFSKLESILKEEITITNKKTMNTNETPQNNIPKDFLDALESGDVRYTPSIVTGVNYDYRNAKQKALGQVIFSLWFGVEVDSKVSQYIELIMKMLADHGAAVSGAHNTIVTTRAGKDLVSSLVSGLLTVGPRFGGAINGSAESIFKAVNENKTPEEFVAMMKTNNTPILGIGHRKYSVTDNDPRVVELLSYAEANFISHTHLDYFKKVEALTLAKRDNLIINVDGAIAVTLLDLFEDLKINKDMIEKYLQAEALNGLFVLSRSIGLIAHHIDQVKLGEGLYRHPEYDIFTIPKEK